MVAPSCRTAGSPGRRDATKQMTLLKAASWNIRKCVGLDWRRNPHRVAHVLAGLGADIVAVSTEKLDVVLLSTDEVQKLVGLHVDEDADELTEVSAKYWG